ncbi:hypothetical protein NKH72_12965 [Mesorhizobium sp. M0955]|uniref:hypothetical protein n=1 Tax=Mesorhizobium sp. M0955 TaxID=2957033 RepID=UPI00333D41FC
MNEKSDRTANQLPLPALKPRARSDDPFSRNMAAIVESSISETDNLEQQTRPRSAREAKAKLERPKADGETARLHTRIPVSEMIELQVHCARNRTTMQEVVQGLITEFLARQPR